jgi:hypothetical protein
MKVRFFEALPVALPRKEIMSRLGYVKGKTQTTRQQQAAVERAIYQAVVLIELKGALVRLDIEHIGSGTITLSNSIKFSSKTLARLLAGCSEVLLLGATAGSPIVEAIAAGAAGEDVTKAVVFDAVAGEMTDAALDWMVEYMNRSLRRENKCVTQQRFSAGYGDFILENQKLFYNALGLKKIGVEITGHNILIPEKTVTAVAGIGVIT